VHERPDETAPLATDRRLASTQNDQVGGKLEVVDLERQ
jgi:hypothetical protein